MNPSLAYIAVGVSGGFKGLAGPSNTSGGGQRSDCHVSGDGGFLQCFFSPLFPALLGECRNGDGIGSVTLFGQASQLFAVEAFES